MKQKTLAWQMFFEEKIKNIIYQSHFFLEKVNDRGKQQSRVILVTDKVKVYLIQFLFNVSFTVNLNKENIFEIDEIKWAMAIESIKTMVIYKKKALEIKLLLDKNINKKVVEENKMKLKNKSERVFLLYSNEDYKQFIFHIRRLYYFRKTSFLQIKLE